MKGIVFVTDVECMELISGSETDDVDSVDFTAMECTNCGKIAEVPTKQADIWIAENVQFDCSFVRGGGCISRLRRRKR